MHPQPTEDSGLLFAVGILYFLLGFAISTSWVMDILYSARRFTIDISKTCGGKVTLSFNPLGASQFFLILNCFARCVAVYVRPDDRPDKFGVVVIDLFERIPALFIVTASSLLVFAWGYVITTCVWDAERWRKGFAISTLLFNLIVYSVYSVALAVDHDGISTAVPGSAALVLWNVFLFTGTALTGKLAKAKPFTAIEEHMKKKLIVSVHRICTVAFLICSVTMVAMGALLAVYRDNHLASVSQRVAFRFLEIVIILTLFASTWRVRETPMRIRALFEANHPRNNGDHA